jgi:hypothetical protein
MKDDCFVVEFSVIQLSLLFLEMKLVVEDKATLMEKYCK